MSQANHRRMPCSVLATCNTKLTCHCSTGIFSLNYATVAYVIVRSDNWLQQQKAARKIKASSGRQQGRYIAAVLLHACDETGTLRRPCRLTQRRRYFTSYCSECWYIGPRRTSDIFFVTRYTCRLDGRIKLFPLSL